MIVVGLGNPGRRYRGTRHNVGQDVARRLADRFRIRLEGDGRAAAGKARVGSATLVLAIPETYMNVSGQAVRDLLRRRRRRPEDLLVVHDDLDLILGHLRLRPGDGAGGHNGVRSIIEELGTGAFPRLRIGMGRFDYDHRGILDATHLRFFTWRSFAALAYRAGWLVEERRLTGLPLEILDRDTRSGSKRPMRALVSRVDRAGRAIWPSLFAYQYVAVLTRDPARLPATSGAS